MNRLKTIRPIAALALAGALAWVPLANAFVITAQLTGDIRPANPDGIVIDVTITTTSATTADWVIDINSPLHPSIKLDEFYFNLVGPSTNYSFSNFDPSGWTVGSPATVQGAGGTTFQFEVLDPAGPPNAADVTNSQDLTFTMTSLVALTEDTFLLAPTSVSNDAGSGQLGAHAQALGTNASDSGFAFGNYDASLPPVTVPEPGSLALMGLALLGMAGFRRKKTS